MQGIRRAWMLFAVVAFMVGCVPAGAEIGGSGQALIAPDMVPDPSYQAKEGERATLYAIEDGYVLERLPLLKDLTAYDTYVRSLESKNGERLRELEEQGWLRWAPPGTRVLILSVQDRNHAGAHTATQLRILEDGQKDVSYWTLSEYLARLIHKEPE